MKELKYELDMYPMVKNRSIVNIFPTKVYLDWLNYIHGSDVRLGINVLEPISFLVKDFDDKSLWPEERTFCIFNKWFEIRFSNLILDMNTDSIEMI
jgi:hypothetical protein